MNQNKSWFESQQGCVLLSLSHYNKYVKACEACMALLVSDHAVDAESKAEHYRRAVEKALAMLRT